MFTLVVSQPNTICTFSFFSLKFIEKASATNQEIADKLFISKRTVEGHRQNIMDKIGAKNTVGLIIYAIMHEIYIPDSKYFF